MNSSASTDMSLLEALQVDPISQAVMEECDLGLLTPGIFQQTYNGDDVFPDDGMDEVVSTAAELLENWTEDKSPKVQIISDVVVRRAAKPKRSSSKLQTLLTTPRSSVTKNKKVFYSMVRNEKPAAPAAASNDGFLAPAPPQPTSPILGGRGYKRHMKKQPAAAKGAKKLFVDQPQQQQQQQNKDDSVKCSVNFSQDEEKDKVMWVLAKTEEWKRNISDCDWESEQIRQEIVRLNERLSVIEEHRGKYQSRLDLFKNL